MRASLKLMAAAAMTGLIMNAVQATPAVWKEKEFSFVYHGFTTSYSCDGLKHKVRVILKALGARSKPQVRATGCEFAGQGVAMSPRVHVRAEFPEQVHDDSVASEQFAAQMDVVTLSSRSPRELENGDCELVEQLQRRVFPELGAKVLVDRTSCTPHHVNLGQPYLQLEVLRASADQTGSL
jgi:hypothetical protein